MARDGNHKSATVYHVVLIHVTKISPRASCQSLSIDMATMKRSKSPLNSVCKTIRDTSACTSESNSHEKEKVWWLHIQQQNMFYIKNSSSKISKYTHMEKSNHFCLPNTTERKHQGQRNRGWAGQGRKSPHPNFVQ